MRLRTLLTITIGLLLSTAGLSAHDRLEAYAKFRPTLTVFGDLESTNTRSDGWEFDQTTAFGYEIGSILELDKGLRLELGFLILPDINLSGAQINNGSSLAGQGSDVDLYMDAYAVMVDANWEFTQLFMPKSPFQAYVGLGLGLSYVSVDGMRNRLGPYVETVDGESSLSPAYRISLGAQYQLSEELILTCSYSYMNLGEAELGEKWSNNLGQSGNHYQRALDLDLAAHVFQVGLNFAF